MVTVKPERFSDFILVEFRNSSVRSVETTSQPHCNSRFARIVLPQVGGNGKKAPQCGKRWEKYALHLFCNPKQVKKKLIVARMGGGAQSTTSRKISAK